MDLLDRYRGSLLGLAVGDALGTTLEFRSPGTFTPIRGMTGGGPFGLRPGEWTDDTSMTLCLAASLIECRHFDPVDQLRRYVQWYRHGYMSCTGHCFDIGNTVRTALEAFEQTGDPWSGPRDPYSAGNGSLMRLAPVPLLFAGDPARAVELSGQSSKTTHGARTCVDACRYFGGLILGAVRGLDKETLLSPGFSPSDNGWVANPLCAEIEEVAAGSFKRRNPPEIAGTGYVVKSLEAALWAFWNSRSFEEGCLLAVNLGDDADTTGAVFGQLAGAHYGVNGIPDQWQDAVAMAELIEGFAGRLCEVGSRCGA